MNKSISRLRKNSKRSYSLIMAILVVFSVIFAGWVYLSVWQEPFCANSISCIHDLSGNKEIDNRGIFEGKTVYSPGLPDKANFALGDLTGVLGVTTDIKHIYVDLTNQRLYAFEGTSMVMDVPVSTGKWNPTPAGDFHIWIWLRYTRMTGGQGADYYDLPNVPYTMYFYNNSISKAQGYSLHGAYWHNNFGHPMSHGCVNMRVEDAQKLFYWTNPAAGNTSYPTADNPGTLITVYGINPKK